MTDLVPAEDIERIVGITRHRADHYARADSREEMVYILHSHECKDSGIDLRECPYSAALDRGIPSYDWADHLDTPVRVAVVGGQLIPWPESA